MREQDRIAKLQLRYPLADGLLSGMGEADLRELAQGAGIAVDPDMSEDDLRAAFRADNAARAAGVPIDELPTPTTQQAYDLARRLSGQWAPRTD